MSPEKGVPACLGEQRGSRGAAKAGKGMRLERRSEARTRQVVKNAGEQEEERVEIGIVKEG